MANDIKVHFDPNLGDLHLECGNEAFVRLRNAVIAETIVADATLGQADRIKSIEIYREWTVKPPSKLRDQMWLLGCALAGFVILFVFVAGVTTIVGWVR